MQIINRSRPPAVALETTLLVHGVPAHAASSLAADLLRAVEEHGAHPALVGVVAGRAIVGMTTSELDEMLAAVRAGGHSAVSKLNTSNLGVALHRGAHGATTVSATMELAAAAGVRVFATGGLGGVHKNFGEHWDVSSDLAACARFPVAVVCSGVKSILDVRSTREMLESLGVPVVGYRCERFPAFYMRESDSRVAVDERFDDAADLASFCGAEMKRTGRAVVVANPIPAEHELPRADFDRWLREAEQQTGTGAIGRGATPSVLGALHEISGGATLRANIELVKSSARLAGAIAAAMESVIGR